MNRSLFLTCPLLTILAAQVLAEDIPLLKSSPLEQRFEKLEEAVRGELSPDMPSVWTLKNLTEFGESLQKSHLKFFLNGEGSAPPLISLMLMNTSYQARVRMAAVYVTPAPSNQKQVLAWVDTFVVREQILLHDYLLMLDGLKQYFEFSRKTLHRLPPEQEQKLNTGIQELEQLIRTRLQISRGLIYGQVLDHFEIYQQRKLIPEGLTRQELTRKQEQLLADFPKNYRSSDTLRSYANEVEGELWKHSFPLLNEFHLLDFLLDYSRSLMEQQKELAKQEEFARRDWLKLERHRVLSVLALHRYMHHLLQWRITAFELSTLQGHVGFPYEGKSPPLSSSLTLPKDYQTRLDKFDRRSAEELAKLRNFLAVMEKEVLEKNSWKLKLEDWWVKGGKNLPLNVYQAVVKDLAQWLKDTPALAEVFEEEMLRIAGHLQNDRKFQEFGPEEWKEVQQWMNRSLKDIQAGFDRNTTSRFREDLDMIEAMKKNYPTRDLTLIDEPVWKTEPGRRLKMTDLRNLSSSEAARCYIRLFQQLDEDYKLYSLELRKYLLAVDLNSCLHMRAAAKAKIR